MIRSAFRRLAAGGIGVALVAAMNVAIAPVGAQAAGSESLPQAPSAVPLASTQIDGVAWQQLVVGDTVYVGGSFGTARPAGAAPGVNTVTRKNLLAFNIKTGELINSFVADANGQVLGLAISPDGTRLYVSGEFTSINGVSRYRIAALNPTTGAVIPGFNAQADYRVRSMVVTNDTVYVGGQFSTANGVARKNLAAFRASDGALLNWAPTTDSQVMALAMIPGSGKLVVGGGFSNISGVPAIGLGAVDPITGGTLSYPVNQIVQNKAPDGAIYSLTQDDAHVYGTGYTFGTTGGNFEGNFSADASGNLVWINDIHGDQYDAAAISGMLVTVGHSHADGNIDGGFPQATPSVNHYTLAESLNVTGTLAQNTSNTSRYFAFPGRPSPTVLDWWPDLTAGTFTGQGQAAWTVSGDDRYVVLAGEFTRANTLNQQGIVRFAIREAGMRTDAPRLGAANWIPDLTSPAPGTVQISWQSNWDRDDAELTYWVQREGSGTIATMTGESRFWKQPILTYLDKGLTPGSTQRYRVVATDPSGVRVYGNYASVTVGSAGTLSSYAEGVLADRAGIYNRLSDSGTTVADSAYSREGTVTLGAVRGVAGAIAGDTDTATRFTGTQTATTTNPVLTPTSFTTEAWIRTTSKTGGMIIGFGNRASGSSSSTSSDYRTYMGNDGRIHFGVYETIRSSVSSSKSYNDGAWHHVVSTLDWAGGQQLYVDGLLVAADSGVRHGRNFTGYWRIGGDTLASWPSRPSTDYFSGDIDEVAVYDDALPASRVLAHYALAGGSVPNQAPTASFDAVTTDLGVAVDASASSDVDGSVASYAWTFGDGATGSGVTASHTYAAPGDYTVTLTVTDNDGATNSTTKQVTAQAPNQAPTASFDAVTTDLRVAVDASASSDVDGSVASYAWTFGDGATGSGVTASHTYAAPGDYTVTLTVTDNDGATDAAHKSVSATAPAVFGADDFSRTVATGWGSAEVGGAWAVTGSSANYRVDGSVGVMTLGSAGAKRTTSLPINAADVDVRASVGLDKVANGGGVYVSFGVRSSGTTSYVGRVRLFADGTVGLHNQRIVNGTATTLAGGTVSGLTHEAGQRLNVRLQITGSGTTTIRTKVWLAGTPEPASWQYTSTDSTASLQSAGGFFIEGYLSGSTTNAPVALSVDDLTIAAP